MVFYFMSEVVSPPAVIYMGKDKYERLQCCFCTDDAVSNTKRPSILSKYASPNDDEELIRWGWPEDVWFHVHNFSSAHVYLRLDKNRCIDDIPVAVLEDVAQLVKYNSIQGNKTHHVDIVYTPWSNLKKTPDMEPGQVTFFRDNEVKKIHVEKRKNEIINRLNKTKSEDYPDLRRLKEDRDLLERNEKKKLLKIQKEKEAEELKRQKEESEIRRYSTLFKPENMISNNADGNDSDEFM